MAQNFLIGDQITTHMVVLVLLFFVVVNKAQLHPKYIKNNN